MTIKPVRDNIVIRLEKEDEKLTNSGILIVSKKNDYRCDRGIVEAVGGGRILNSGTLIAPCVKEGDRVLFNKFAGSEIVAGEEKYLMIKENDILAILEE